MRNARVRSVPHSALRRHDQRHPRCITLHSRAARNCRHPAGALPLLQQLLEEVHRTTSVDELLLYNAAALRIAFASAPQPRR